MGGEWYAHVGRDRLGHKGDTRWEVIPDAEPLVIPGWEHLDMCISPEWEPFRWEPRGWIVTEGSTGLRAAEGETRDDAVEQAIVRLNRYGRDKFARLVETALAQYGTSPRYADEGKASEVQP